MLAVVQRVRSASVSVAATGYRAEIGPGLCVLLGVERGDADPDAGWMAGKLARLRIFRDDTDRMNRSVQDVGGAILLISQFTLAGDCRKGNRPSFVRAADPEMGRILYEAVGRRLRDEHRLPVETGVFGAMMDIALVNDGPVTIIVRTDPPHAV
ncbi:MAG: D-tyrosyl-tRNA(Tyr) deacylase [Phycisphaerales bacterium]|nr:D-tyrosyl-tRNA(Tyr) deacylase [Phycisphaerae bacterium]NNF41927.1 D-tyrosyl-tRNA(Tyr) deacylase [Phycisphaerales bacterium]NNM26393.1 D-tyrosyl-tRNA(Tyr) deacylase [Phycisphaerales bacterium]